MASWLGGAAWLLGVFSLLFSLGSIAAALWLFKRRLVFPEPADLPPVTLLKPLKGEDRDLYENLASFCRLDYPRLQMIFTLASPSDPALRVVERLRRDFPGVDMEIVVSQHRIGLNPKVNNAANAERFIKHDLILFSDSDIRVRRDFLRRMVAPLSDPRVGLVTSFYQSTTPRGLWSRLEALSVNAQFLPQAVTAAAFGMRFAMGAAILVRREAFAAAGGFAGMADHIADDFVLGEGVRRAGWRLELAPAVVDSVPDVGSALDHLRHQVRWQRTIRICNPSGYAGTLLLHGFSALCLKMLLLGPDAATAALAAAVLLAKAAAKTAIAEVCLGGRQSHAGLLALPLSEWLSCAAWAAGFWSRSVLWRGELYAVEDGGRLTPLAPAPAGGLPPLGLPSASAARRA